VFKTTWADPEDDKPSASRVARQVSGYRQYDPLRRCRARHGDRASFSVEHVGAADRLRSLFDGNRLGFSSLRDWRPVSSVNYRPMTGPTKPAIRQLRCRREFDRIWSMFDDRARALLASVVLQNVSVSKTARVLGLSQALTMQLLIAALDRLCLHFDIREGEAQQAA
jgi:hypothetical protein